MMRAAPFEELEDERLIDIERRGVLLGEDYDRLLEENEIEQQRNNQRYAECKDKEDKTDLINTSFDQILLDTRMRGRYDSIYQRERDYASKQRIISGKGEPDSFIVLKKHHRTREQRYKLKNQVE